MSSPDFFAELKRRNVYKVAVAYAVVGWLVMQVCATIVPALHMPEGFTTAVVVVVLLGFPIALVIAWAFEMTPEGMKRTENVAPDEKIPQWSRRKFFTLIGSLATVAAALLAWQFLRPKARAVAPTVAAPAPAVAPAAAVTAPEKSIAVLPFENLSSDKENAYFADGIQDEILTRLSKIGALKVISRTSTQKYKSAPGNLRDVSSQLGVANILEGSVQKIGNAAHINVQLIRAATDEHLWAESYNRKLDDVFSVEGEVATAIAEQLNAKLTGAEHNALAQKPTENAAAYDAYLRALTIEHRGFSYEAFGEAVTEYARAVELDPQFALAWARLAVLHGILHFNGVNLSTNTAASVKEAADKASALQPELGETWVARGAYRYRVQRDFPGALQAYEEARKRLPNSALVYESMAYVERRLGKWGDAEGHYKKALELDPQNTELFGAVGAQFFVYLRRFDDAHAALDRALQISPGEPSALAGKAFVFQQQGRLEEAAAALARIPAQVTDDYVSSARVAQAIFERHFDVAIRVVEQQLQSIPAGQPLDRDAEWALVLMGFCQQWLGRRDEAMHSFTRAVHSMKPTPDAAVADVPGERSNLALAYAGLRQKENALQQAEAEVKFDEADAIDKPNAMVNLAQIQALLGDRDAAIAALPKLLKVPAGLSIADLKLDPFWDTLRKDPRFIKLLAEPQAAQ